MYMTVCYFLQPCRYTLLATPVDKLTPKTGLMDTKPKGFDLGAVILRSRVGATWWTLFISVPQDS